MAALNLPARLLHMYHVVTPLLIDSVQLLHLLLVGQADAMYLV
jgi:hypothetical protein